MNYFFYMLGMESLQTQIVVTRLEKNPSLIQDVIPDEKKPLEPPLWTEENEEENFEDDYDE